MKSHLSIRRLLLLVLRLLRSSFRDFSKKLALVWSRLWTFMQTLLRRNAVKGLDHNASKGIQEGTSSDPQHPHRRLDQDTTPTISCSYNFTPSASTQLPTPGGDIGLSQISEGNSISSQPLPYYPAYGSPYRAEDQPQSDHDVTNLTITPGSALALMWSQYDQDLVVQSNQQATLAPLETQQRLVETPIDGWNSFVHPQGWPYFYSTRRKFRFATQAYLFDSMELRETNCAADSIEERASNYALSAEVEIVLERIGPWSFKYYMVDLTSRCLFFVDDAEYSDLSFPSMIVQSKQHLQFALDIQYWKHLELFPRDKMLSDDFWRELEGILMHGAIDTVGDPDSVYPYNNERMHDLLRIFLKLKSSWQGDRENAYVVSAAAQLMSVFGGKRAINRFGQRNAKLKRSQREILDDQKIWHSRMEDVLSTLMFFAPRVYYDQFRETNSNLLTEEEWVPVFESLISDWQQIVINAAVLMNANIAFLAIPGVPGETQNRFTPIEVICQCSILLSLSSMIVGLVLLKQYYVTENKIQPLFLDFVKTWYDEDVGLYAAAFMFSIPYVFLIWSTALFLISLGLFSFSFGGIWQLSVISFTWFCAVLLGIWGIFARQSFKAYWYNILETCRNILCLR